jgi:hypothetical protein
MGARSSSNGVVGVGPPRERGATCKASDQVERRRRGVYCMHGAGARGRGADPIACACSPQRGRQPWPVGSHTCLCPDPDRRHKQPTSSFALAP